LRINQQRAGRFNDGHAMEQGSGVSVGGEGKKEQAFQSRCGQCHTLISYRSAGKPSLFFCFSTGAELPDAVKVKSLQYR
ncbi:MAG: hypothetical protein ACOYNZ_19845, partial [Rhodoferax sp.]